MPQLERFTALRLPDWATQLSHFLLEFHPRDTNPTVSCGWEETPLMYSCGRFGGLAIEAMTGVDPFEPLITEVPFDSALGAARFLKKWGVNSVDEMMNAIFPRIPIFKAKRGDIVTVPADLGAEADEVAYGGMFATVGIADPPFFWALGVEGLAKGDLYGRANLRPYHAYSIGWDLPATNQATED